SDITQRKQAEMALFEEKERVRVTLSSIADGVVTTDESGKVTFLNPIAEQMTGWSRESALAVRIEEVMDIRDAATGLPMTNPVRIALQENRIVGLNTNCVLQSRQSGQYNIEDSA